MTPLAASAPLRRLPVTLPGAWPQAQSKPDGLTNRVVLNIDKIRIVRIDKVDLDPKKFQLIEGSVKEIPLDSF